MMRRLLLVAAVIAASLTAVQLHPANAASTFCAGTITGTTATTNGHCILLAYQYRDGFAPTGSFDPASFPQTLVDSDGAGATLSVAPPSCGYQLDLVDQSADVKNVLTNPNEYTDQGVLVASSQGGTTACTSTTTTSTSTTTTSTSTTTSTTSVPKAPTVAPAYIDIVTATPRFTG